MKMLILSCSFTILLLSSCASDNKKFIIDRSGLNKCILKRTMSLKEERQGVLKMRIFLDKSCNKEFTDPIEHTGVRSCKKLIIHEGGCGYFTDAGYLITIEKKSNRVYDVIIIL